MNVQGKNRVFVVDDQPIVRQSLTLLINREADLMVCGEAGDVQAAVVAVPVANPDILILDISLNGSNALDSIKDVRMRYPELPVLLLSMHEEPVYAERALRAGAQGYIMKQEASEKVPIAVRRILSHEIYISERIANRMLQRYIGSRSIRRPSSIAELTDREQEVFRLIGEGHSTRRIAEELHISVKTVECYQAHIKEKLSLRNARELVQHAIQWSIGERSA